ncbi:hypothetical protein BGX38DRAFT_664235 [Terfezia claveryi]|nr:hypothetical protein BGX38DRAFT_664235 [Terfezia claveryi]
MNKHYPNWDPTRATSQWAQNLMDIAEDAEFRLANERGTLTSFPLSDKFRTAVLNLTFFNPALLHVHSWQTHPNHKALDHVPISFSLSPIHGSSRTFRGFNWKKTNWTEVSRILPSPPVITIRSETDFNNLYHTVTFSRRNAHQPGQSPNGLDHGGMPTSPKCTESRATSSASSELVAHQKTLTMQQGMPTYEQSKRPPQSTGIGYAKTLTPHPSGTPCAKLSPNPLPVSPQSMVPPPLKTKPQSSAITYSFPPQHPLHGHVWFRCQNLSTQFLKAPLREDLLGHF